MLVDLALILLFIFTIKHMIVDYMLQTPWMIANKSRYWHPAGFLHATQHGFGTFMVFLIAIAVVPQSPQYVFVSPAVVNRIEFGVLLALIDIVVHHSIDWIKTRIVHHYGWTPSNRSFWVAFGIDQTLHGLTYIGLVWLWISQMYGIPNR